MFSYARMTKMYFRAAVVKPAVDPGLSIIKELLSEVIAKFPPVDRKKETIKKMAAVLDGLLTILSAQEIKTIIRHSANVSILLTFKEDLLDKLVTAGILDEVRLLFDDTASVIYANEKYYQCLIFICQELEKLDKLTTKNLAAFLAKEDSFICFDQVKQALAFMHNNQLETTDHHVYTLLLFPHQVLLVASLLMQRNPEISEDTYCRLIKSYFENHPSDVTSFGCHRALTCHLKEEKKEREKQHYQVLWQGVYAAWSGAATESAPSNANLSM